MYGIEPSTGVGGLAAQAPAGDRYLARTLAIRPGASALRGGPPQSGVMLAAGAAMNTQTALPIVSDNGAAVERPSHQMLSDWRQVLDFHNSPTPWILIGLLVLYGWLHTSARASRGGRVA